MMICMKVHVNPHFSPEGLPEISHVMRKPVFGVSDQVQHKLRCTATENGGLYYLCSKNKDVDQLFIYCTDDQSLCFCIC